MNRLCMPHTRPRSKNKFLKSRFQYKSLCPLASSSHYLPQISKTLNQDRQHLHRTKKPKKPDKPANITTMAPPPFRTFFLTLDILASIPWFILAILNIWAMANPRDICSKIPGIDHYINSLMPVSLGLLPAALVLMILSPFVYDPILAFNVWSRGRAISVYLLIIGVTIILIPATVPLAKTMVIMDCRG